MGKQNDKSTPFDKQLIASMEEAAGHAAGTTNHCRETVVEYADAKAIREGLGLSQSAFSRAFGIPLKTLQHWEQGRHAPDRTASAYLWTIEAFPKNQELFFPILQAGCAAVTWVGNLSAAR